MYVNTINAVHMAEMSLSLYLLLSCPAPALLSSPPPRCRGITFHQGVDCTSDAAH